ncbi:MAG: hypothetical protein Fur0018_10830 [Anaerolineales bacterium]
MSDISTLGLAIVLFLQNLGEGLRTWMSFFTFLGSEEFVLLFIPALYWCVDTGLGLRAGVLFFLSSATGDIIKILLHTPRPFWVSTAVKTWGSEASFGMPSLHAQNAVVLWSTLGTYLQRGWGWLLASALIFLVSISRLYLGVHFPQDTLLGWGIGALLLGLAAWLQPAFDSYMRLPQWKRMAAAGALSLALIVFGAASSMYTAITWQIPRAWMETFTQNAPGADFNPLDISIFFSLGGVLFGMAVGALWLQEHGGYVTAGPIGERIQRYVLGIVVTIGLWYGLKLVFPGGLRLAAMLFRSLRYALVGGWVSAGAPLAFRRLGWARAAQGRPSQTKG